MSGNVLLDDAIHKGEVETIHALFESDEHLIAAFQVPYQSKYIDHAITYVKDKADRMDALDDVFKTQGSQLLNAAIQHNNPQHVSFLLNQSVELTIDNLLTAFSGEHYTTAIADTLMTFLKENNDHRYASFVSTFQELSNSWDQLTNYKDTYNDLAETVNRLKLKIEPFEEEYKKYELFLLEKLPINLEPYKNCIIFTDEPLAYYIDSAGKSFSCDFQPTNTQISQLITDKIDKIETPVTDNKLLNKNATKEFIKEYLQQIKKIFPNLNFAVTSMQRALVLVHFSLNNQKNNKVQRQKLNKKDSYLQQLVKFWQFFNFEKIIEQNLKKQDECKYFAYKIYLSQLKLTQECFAEKKQRIDAKIKNIFWNDEENLINEFQLLNKEVINASQQKMDRVIVNLQEIDVLKVDLLNQEIVYQKFSKILAKILQDSVEFSPELITELLRNMKSAFMDTPKDEVVEQILKKEFISYTDPVRHGKQVSSYHTSLSEKNLIDVVEQTYKKLEEELNLHLLSFSLKSDVKKCHTFVTEYLTAIRIEIECINNLRKKYIQDYMNLLSKLVFSARQDHPNSNLNLKQRIHLSSKLPLTTKFSKGNTILHLGVIEDCPALVKFILETGTFSDQFILNNEGIAAFQLAFEMKKTQIIDIFVSYWEGTLKKFSSNLNKNDPLKMSFLHKVKEYIINYSRNDFFRHYLELNQPTFWMSILQTFYQPEDKLNLDLRSLDLNAFQELLYVAEQSCNVPMMIKDLDRRIKKIENENGGITSPFYAGLNKLVQEFYTGQYELQCCEQAPADDEIKPYVLYVYLKNKNIDYSYINYEGKITHSTLDPRYQVLKYEHHNIYTAIENKVSLTREQIDIMYKVIEPYRGITQFIADQQFFLNARKQVMECHLQAAWQQAHKATVRAKEVLINNSEVFKQVKDSKQKVQQLTDEMEKIKLQVHPTQPEPNNAVGFFK